MPVALYEAGSPFETVPVEGEAYAAFKAIRPLGKFPVLVDEARGVRLPEASIVRASRGYCRPMPIALLPPRSHLDGSGPPPL